MATDSFLAKLDATLECPMGQEPLQVFKRHGDVGNVVTELATWRRLSLIH